MFGAEAQETLSFTTVNYGFGSEWVSGFASSRNMHTQSTSCSLRCVLELCTLVIPRLISLG